MAIRIFLSSFLALVGMSCHKTQDKESTSVPATSLQPGPIQHTQLTEKQLERIRKLHQSFVDVDNSSLETWIDNFKRDTNPDNEIAIWERVAAAYTKYCSQRQLTVEAKKEVHSILLLRSMTPESEVLSQIKLAVLTTEDAKEVLKLY